MLTQEANGRLIPPRKIFFAEMCLIKQEQNEVTLSASNNFKTKDRFGIRSQEMTTVNCLIDTDGGSNLGGKSLLHPSRILHIKRLNFSKLKSANKRPISSERVILLQSRVGDLHIRVLAGVVNHFAVDLLLGFTFIN